MHLRSWAFCILVGLLGLTVALPASARAQWLATPTPSPTLTPTPTPPPLQVISPRPGEALLGSFPVLAQITLSQVQLVELSFGYEADATGTWFLIAQTGVPQPGQALAIWDTTQISDGNYTLRLLVETGDSPPFLYLVEGLRVRNYSPVETDTPTPVTPSVTPEPGEPPLPTATPTDTATPIPLTVTPLPTNPAELLPVQINASLGAGVLAIFGLFALLGAYLGLRNWQQNRT